MKRVCGKQRTATNPAIENFPFQSFFLLKGLAALFDKLRLTKCKFERNTIFYDSFILFLSWLNLQNSIPIMKYINIPYSNIMVQDMYPSIH